MLLRKVTHKPKQRELVVFGGEGSAEALLDLSRKSHEASLKTLMKRKEMDLDLEGLHGMPAQPKLLLS